MSHPPFASLSQYHHSSHHNPSAGSLGGKHRWSVMHDARRWCADPSKIHATWQLAKCDIQNTKASQNRNKNTICALTWPTLVTTRREAGVSEEKKYNQTRVSPVCKYRFKSRVEWFCSQLYSPASGYMLYPLALPCSDRAMSALCGPSLRRVCFRTSTDSAVTLKATFFCFYFPEARAPVKLFRTVSQGHSRELLEINLPHSTVKSEKTMNRSTALSCVFFLVLLSYEVN